MLVGLATELVDIELVRSELAASGPPTESSPWTASERATCLSRADPAPGLAARLAAKRATLCALGLTDTGTADCLREIELHRREDGRPELVLTGAAERAAGALGVSAFHVSLSHERSTALAVVILED